MKKVSLQVKKLTTEQQFPGKLNKLYIRRGCHFLKKLLN